MFNYEHDEHYNRGYQPIACAVPGGGSSHASAFSAFGIILVFIFLIILFSAFRGHGGLGGDYGHVGGGCGRDGGWGRGGSIADFEAIAQNNNRVDRSEVALSNYVGNIKEQITLGNFQISKQISDTAAAAELRACMEREADFRTKLSEQNAKILMLESNAINERRFDALGATLADIKCRMQEKVVAQPVVGVERLGCTNEPFRGFPFGGGFEQPRRDGNCFNGNCA